ncbi:MAG TPA: hypothetical protein VG841_00295 [Caulobacterales bacterium]|nr:hypothetical protein [Caulobacterales bacterium]
MTDLEFTDLGADGIEYVRAHLLGANVFCTALLAAVEAAPGKVTTLAPRGAPRERLLRLDEGGLLKAEHAPARVVRIADGSALHHVPSLKVEQGAYLVSMLRAAPDAICIVDDFNPSWVEVRDDAGPAAFGVNDEVYHLFTSTNAPAEVVQALVDGDTGWHGVAALCTEAPEIDVEREADEETLQRAALSAFVITCSAYDGEGFVIWRRT